MAWNLEIHTIDVKQGESSLIIAYDNDNQQCDNTGMRGKGTYKTMLIDGGEANCSSKVHEFLTEKLTNRNMRLNYMVFTHFDKDHSNGLLALLASENFTELSVNFCGLVKSIENNVVDSDHEKVKKKREFWLFNALCCLYPKTKNNLEGKIYANYNELKEHMLGLLGEAVTVEDLLQKSNENCYKLVFDVNSVNDKLFTFINTLSGLMSSTFEIENDLEKQKKTFEVFTTKCAYPVITTKDYLFTRDDENESLYKGVQIITPGIRWASLKDGLWKMIQEVFEGKIFGFKNKTHVRPISCYINNHDKRPGLIKVGKISEHEKLNVKSSRITETQMDIGTGIFYGQNLKKYADKTEVRPEAYLICGDLDYLDKPTLLNNSIENAISVGILIQFNNFSFYTAGDLEGVLNKGCEEELGMQLKKYVHEKRVTGIKCGHHGSENCTSKDFLSYVQPRFAVISCGRGSSGTSDQKFKHPRWKVLDNLNNPQSGIPRVEMVYLTNCDYRFLVPETYDGIAANGAVTQDDEISQKELIKRIRAKNTTITAEGVKSLNKLISYNRNILETEYLSDAERIYLMAKVKEVKFFEEGKGKKKVTKHVPIFDLSNGMPILERPKFNSVGSNSPSIKEANGDISFTVDFDGSIATIPSYSVAYKVDYTYEGAIPILTTRHYSDVFPKEEAVKYSKALKKVKQ